MVEFEIAVFECCIVVCQIPLYQDYLQSEIVYFK